MIKAEFEKAFDKKHGKVETFSDERRKNWATWGFIQGMETCKEKTKQEIEVMIKEFEDAKDS